MDFEWQPVETRFRTEVKTTRIITQKEKIFCTFDHGDLKLIDGNSHYTVEPLFFG